MMSRLFGFVSQQVSITILDENDNSPVFDITSDTSVDIAENTPMGEKVAVVLGRDKDAGLNGLVRMVSQHGPNDHTSALLYSLTHFHFMQVLTLRNNTEVTRTCFSLTSADSHSLVDVLAQRSPKVTSKAFFLPSVAHPADCYPLQQCAAFSLRHLFEF